MRPDANLNKPLAIIFFIIVINLIGFGIIIPLLPFYAERLGASELTIGILFSSFSIAQLIASPFIGFLADRLGRKPVLIVSLIGTAISFALLAVAQSLWLLFLARILDGISGGNITIARTYIADLLEEKDRSKGYGLIGAAFGIGFIAGPLLSGFLVTLSLSAPAWVATALALLACFATAVWLPETLRKAKEERRSFWQDFAALSKLPNLRFLLILNFLMWAAFSVYQTTFALFVSRRFSFSPEYVSYSIAFVGVLGVITQGWLVRIIVPKIGEKKALVLGLLLSGLGLGIAAFAPTPVLFLLCLIPSAIGNGMAVPSLLSLLSTQAPMTLQGSLQGINGSIESLSRIVGPIWGNGLLAISLPLSYLSAAIVLVGIGVSSFLRLKTPE